MPTLKFWYFALAALNTLGSTWFGSYIFFFLRDRFGYGNRENLWVSALYGFVYMLAAWQCGKFAPRRGFITSLKVGFAGLTIMMVVGALVNSVFGIMCALVGYTIALLFTWPALEALVSENETRAGVQHNVGIYNCTWALAGALSYFVGGTLYDRFGHAAGDAALTAVAERLQANVRDIDIVGRMGGDEFAVILVQADQATAEAKASSLARAIEAEPLRFGDWTAPLHVSFGVCEISQDADPEAIVAQADAAMFARKRERRSA